MIAENFKNNVEHRNIYSVRKRHMKLSVGELREVIREVLESSVMLPPPDPHGEVDPRDFLLPDLKKYDAEASKRLETMADRFGKDTEDFLSAWREAERDDEVEAFLSQLRKGEASSDSSSPDKDTIPAGKRGRDLS